MSRPILVASMTTLADLARLLAERPGLRLELTVKPGLAGGTIYRIVTGDNETVEVWSLASAVNHALELHDEARFEKLAQIATRGTTS